MNSEFAISIIIPFFNTGNKIIECLNSLNKQDIKENIELIFVNDFSNDNTLQIIKSYGLKKKFKIISLKKNFGPSGARNEGIKEAKGSYIFFQDADDLIELDALSKLYHTAIKDNYDMVFCDKKRIQYNINHREGVFAFNEDKIFDYKDITNEIKKRITDPEYTVGVAGCHGKLIKKSIIDNNKILFENELRFLEDEIFIIDILGCSNKIKYIKEQLYIYNINPKEATARSDAFSYPFPIKNFKLMSNHIKKNLYNRKLNSEEILNFANQALIYYSIYSLVSFSLCIFRGKVDFSNGIKQREIIINDIINDNDFKIAINNYKRSKSESILIPFAIKLKSKKFLELACNFRAKSLLKKIKQ